jgi:aminoglycoside phosphotransferase (APT) family kinase protein
VPVRPPESARRLAAVCAAAGLAPTEPPTPVVSYSNDTWLLDSRHGSAVLRICWRGDITRLDREAAVGGSGPAEFGYPEILGHGSADDGGQPLRWTLTRRLTGQPVDLTWPGLSRAARRSAVARLADMLRVLHDWRPPAEVARLVRDRPALDLGSSESIVGADMNALPLPRAQALAGFAARLPFVDAGLVRAALAAIEALADLAPVVDDPSVTGLIHADVHLNNLWWDGSRVAALLDFEWVRFGPRQLELERLADNADVDVREGLDVYPQTLAWLLADYPQLADAPRMPDRLRLYALTQALRQLFAWPPDRPEPQLPHDHPLVRLRRLVDGTWPAAGALPAPLLP